MSVLYSTYRSNAAAIAARMIVKFDGAGLVVVADGATAPLAGVSEYGCDAKGDAVSIATAGHGPIVTAGAAIAAGDYLTSNAEGKAIKATTTGQYCIGVAEEVGVADDVITYRPGLTTFSAAA